GAGKTTTLKAISNLLRAERGEVTKGQIVFRGERIDQLDPAGLVKRGICQVMEGRHCFQHLTVEENLLTGAYTRGALGTGLREDLEKVYAYFPRLKERRHSQSGYTSGGEQQMTAIGRALMARPTMILLDEPSMGLAPQGPVVKYFDRLETRLPRAREAALMAALPRHIAHAKRRAPGFARILKDVDAAKINSRKALAGLPVTRKSDLASLQKELPPLGGLNATPVEKIGRAACRERGET